MRTIIFIYLLIFISSIASAGPLSCNLIDSAIRTLEKKSLADREGIQFVRDETQFIEDVTTGKIPFKVPTDLAAPIDSVEGAMADGMTFKEAINLQLNGDMDLAKHFDKNSGKLNFRPSGAGRLAPEDGSAPLDAVRINFDDSQGFQGARISREILNDYSEAMKKIPGMELWVVTGRWNLLDVQNAVEKLPKEIRSRIKITVSDGNPSLWAQDGSKPLEGKRETLARRLSVEEADYSKQTNEYLKSTAALADSNLAQVKTSAIPFEGGNVIVSKDDVFVGTKVVKDLMQELRITRSQAKKVLSKEFGKPVIEMGVPDLVDKDLIQNGFHIDLDMAILQSQTRNPDKKGVAVVQSPSKLLEDAFGFPPLEKVSEAKFQRLKIEALKKLDKKAKEAPLSIGEKSLVGFLRDANYDLLKKEKAATDYMASQAARSGYAVERVPGVSNDFDPDRIYKAGEALPFYSYTNVVVTGNKVLLPEYGAAKLDQAAKKVYEDLGYEVIPMKSAVHSICLMGGTRCSSETYRKPISPRAANQ